VGIGFLIELGYLDGRKALGDKYDVYSVMKCDTTNG
jgi:adenine/guanine phosphoribosyltransferase-like PRPP-binding protein